MERDQGFEFGSEVTGGRVPREYFSSVQKGIVKAMDEGVLAGYPMVDLRAVLYDGSYHDVDSSGLSFEIAGNQALRKGVSEASPVLLEPIMKLTVTVPDAYTGEVMSDLNGKRSRILGMVPQDGTPSSKPKCPGRGAALRPGHAVSDSGKRQLQLEFDRYEPVPPNLEPRVIEDAKRVREEGEGLVTVSSAGSSNR